MSQDEKTKDLVVLKKRQRQLLAVCILACITGMIGAVAANLGYRQGNLVVYIAGVTGLCAILIGLKNFVEIWSLRK